jgi:two-component system sensor histidine kinase UhpB
LLPDALVVVVSYALLIAALVAQHLRRRRVERLARVNEVALRESCERVRLLATGLIRAQEAARARIARDLHDDICQRLAALSIGIGDITRRRIHGQEFALQPALTTLHGEVLDLLDAVRRISHELHPNTLRQLGLVAALEAHCFEVEQRHDVQVALRAEGDLITVGGEISLCLFRIAQESLRNAAVHTEARHLTVTVRRLAGEVIMTITDDGQGFDVSGVRGHRGLGLVSMEERARLVEGTLQIASRPGSGTTVEVRVPVPLAAAAAE